MFKLFELSTVDQVSLFCDWIELKDLANVDTAVCNTLERISMIRLFQSQSFVIPTEHLRCPEFLPNGDYSKKKNDLIVLNSWFFMKQINQNTFFCAQECYSTKQLKMISIIEMDLDCRIREDGHSPSCLSKLRNVDPFRVKKLIIYSPDYFVPVRHLLAGFVNLVTLKLDNWSRNMFSTGELFPNLENLCFKDGMWLNDAQSLAKFINSHCNLSSLTIDHRNDNGCFNLLKELKSIPHLVTKGTAVFYQNLVAITRCMTGLRKITLVEDETVNRRIGVETRAIICNKIIKSLNKIRDVECCFQEVKGRFPYYLSGI